MGPELLGRVALTLARLAALDPGGRWVNRPANSIRETADGPTRVFTLLHDAPPVLLNLGEPGGFDISPWANRVWLVDARHDGVWELPVLGEIAAPPAVVIRPDGHVAWAGDLTDPELPQALATWFGAATPA